MTFEGRQVTYGTYLTEDLAGDTQARWRLTQLLPAADPEQIVALPASGAVGEEFVVTSGSPGGMPRKRLDDRECGSITGSSGMTGE